MVVEAAEIRLDHGTDIGVERRRRGALVFPVLPQDLVRQRDEYVGHCAPHDLPDAPLVRRIRVRVEQAHSHRLDAPLKHRAHKLFDRCVVERDQNLACGVDPFRHFERQAALDQRTGAVEEQVERFDPVAPSDHVDITKTFGRNQRGARPFPLEHRVDCDGRAVEHFGEPRHVAAHEIERVRHTLRWICGNGRRLGRDDVAVDDADEIGERAADVHADRVHEFFQRVKRRSITRTSSFNPIAISASTPMSANRGDGSNVSANSFVK